LEQLAQWTELPNDQSLAPWHCSEPDNVATDILSLLLVSRFRKGSLDAMGVHDFIRHHQGLVAKRVQQGLPIQLTLIGFPFKAPNPLKVGQRSLPDLAEIAALKMLFTIREMVRAIYAPGMEIVIIHDGTYIANALEVPMEEVRLYTEYFSHLLGLTGADRFIRCEDLSDLMQTYGPGAEAFTSMAQTILESQPGRPGQGDAAFRKTLGMLNLRSVSSSDLLPIISEVISKGSESRSDVAGIVYKRVGKAMARYDALDALLHQCDPRPHAFPEAIHTTTRCQPGRLAIWLVRRGKGMLPWQGVGVLQANGRIDVSYHIDVERSGAYRPVFVDEESTPFFYEHCSKEGRPCPSGR
jgi:hypothetical protein